MAAMFTRSRVVAFHLLNICNCSLKTLLEAVTRLLTDCSRFYPYADHNIAENLIVRLEVDLLDRGDQANDEGIPHLKSLCRLGLGFPSSVVFKLIEGSGPVHLTGSVYQELYLLDDEEKSDDDDDEDGELVKTETKETTCTKKRPLAVVTPKGPPRKVARVEAEDEEESDDEDDDDDADESEESTEESTKMEVDVKQKPKSSQLKLRRQL
ncbi:Nucleophosmin [Desmophyllum pertusum]|uniref:Nucleophosmin n=1 Tax=Desmophyllum pertusum TaxID=174260 RepID=A0A9W9ZRF4_9CNID|nr:Nucleophosmin [Desmophyllum pertusum]